MRITKEANKCILYQVIENYQKDARDEKAWIYLNSIIDHNAEYTAKKLYSSYGKPEMDAAGLAMEDLVAEGKIAAFCSVSKFTLNREWNSAEHLRKAFSQYVDLHAAGAMKRAIENASGISHYNAWNIMHIKTLGLDLFESPDEELYESLKYTCKTKYPAKKLNELREMVSRKTVALEEADSLVSTYGLSDDFFDFVRMTVGDYAYEILYACAFSPQKLSIRRLSEKMGIPVSEINLVIKEALRNLRKALRNMDDYADYDIKAAGKDNVRMSNEEIYIVIE